MSQDQLSLQGMSAIGSQRRRQVRRGQAANGNVTPTDELPVARVAVLTPLPHLDRPLDYLVPAALSAAARPGVRVRVRLAGRLHDGFLLERVAGPEEPGRPLQPISSVHGPPVLTAEVARLCRAVADRYAGTFADVVRAAVPPRHARVESRFFDGTGAASSEAPDGSSARPDASSRSRAVLAASSELDAASSPESPAQIDSPVASDPMDAPVDRAVWRTYRGGTQLVAGLTSGSTVRASWLSGPGEDVPARIAELCALAVARGRGALVVAPDAADVDDVARSLTAAGIRCVNLTARSGPEARYRAFLRALTGQGRVVVGTRGAVFAPVADLGLVVVLDDADESLAEPHTPGWHAREVAALRASDPRISLVLAGPSVSLETERMVAVGWLTTVGLPRTTVRARMPHVQTTDQAAHGDAARAVSRVPSVVIELLREATGIGPVLIGVSRAGYLPFLVCERCRDQAICPSCGDPLRADRAARVPICPRHGELVGWHCANCGGERLRAGVTGVRRTAEEFGRALPGIPVLSSSAERGVVRRLTSEHGIVVATPGAEPRPGPGGYSALVLLDVAAALSRPGMRVAEEVLRRWFLAASLVRSADRGGRVLVVGPENLREVQALVRWDPRGYAHRELDERLALALPPAVRTARLSGPAAQVAQVVDLVRSGLGSRIRRCSGPLAGPGVADGKADSEGQATWLVGVALADGHALTALLQQVQAQRSARRAPVITARMDPVAS